MHFLDYNKNLFCTFLSGTTSPFPIIYDAVSEQVLLLILKARQLNEDREFSKWFAEQHLVLTKLRAQSEKINKTYQQESYVVDPHLVREQTQDNLKNALIFMGQLYAGFDEGEVSLKTWRRMNRQPTQLRIHLKQDKLREDFIHDDMFAILTEGSTDCPPIPLQARKGYCHQDLSIAHSCSSELLSRLNDFHKIESLPILANAIYNLITALLNELSDIPAWLSEFEKVHTKSLDEGRPKSDVLGKIINLINDEGRNKFIERIVEQCAPDHAKYLFDHFVGIYASEIIQWLSKLQEYFKNAKSTPFTWKFTTVTPNTSAASEEEIQQPTLAWDSDYCQISIKRDTLLKLIQTHMLHDAANSLADCLWRIYVQPANIMLMAKDTILPTPDSERQVYNSDRFSSHSSDRPQDNYRKYKYILRSFENWHENNKTLLISHKKTRTERVDVEVRQAGLKCYDLKMGIPDGNRMKIKDGVYELVKKDINLRIENSISNVSLQRYHSQVKKIIETDIDALLHSQQSNNSKYPFSGAIKPLWGKSENPE